jgi:hypothetical protein
MACFCELINRLGTEDNASGLEALRAGSEENNVSFRRTYKLRFLRLLSLLLFIISAPSVLSAVKLSVAAEPRWVIRG